MDRRSFLALGGSALLLAGCGSGAGTEPPVVRERATIGLTYIPNVQFAPFYLAEDNQEFGRRGIDATLRHHGAQEGLFEALVQGQEDFVLAGGDELLQARSQGQDLVAVGAYFRTYPVEVVARAGAGIAGLADLRGKRIGVPGRFGESWFGLLVALQNAGLTEADVQVQEIGYTLQAAMASERVDAVVGFSNNDAVQLKLAGVAITEIPLGETVPLVSASLITSRKVIEARPVVVRNVVAAMLAGVKAAVQSPANAVTATGSRLPGQDATALRAARATMDATIPLLSGPDGSVDGHLDPAAWTAMDEFLRNAELVKGNPAVSEAHTNQFVD